MSVAPKCFQEGPVTASDCSQNEDGQSTFWFWFALGVLLFCWIAEATMCAERGF